MGRTNPTYRDFLDSYEREFGDYRRALRRRYQTDFDRLFAGAREFADAAGYANHLDRDVLVLVSMLLAHEGTIREQDAAIEGLREEVRALRERVDADGRERNGGASEGD
jgi:hypothetical protein